MIAEKYLSKSIVSVLLEAIKDCDIVSYSKIELDQFLNFEEEGFYLQAKNGADEISDVRIYLLPDQEFYPASKSVLGYFSELRTIDLAREYFGEPTKTIRSLKIPGAEPTFPGLMFKSQGFIIRAFHQFEISDIVCFHVSNAQIHINT